ncbi:calcium/sodium antiporter [Mesohalobacter halotolerans]|uniref:Calcium/sodium antiporter n=1 Tax=Mesohalobacter halotolerans TaxID=1883405 RepID=A0A4V6ANR7_9FLAO|nr:calcium/sodium antiporter [Mesohalobacter halotolerans]MBS3739491.1 calcium/sodium antiporter [Psychroflexus sp.]TKS55845.1 calcium/sodium antiporter [Mesohalobacter halotolerans]
MDYLLLFLGISLLVIGGEFLVRSSVSISLKLNISKMIVGLTVVSFATSVPELFVSIVAAIEGKPDFAIGNVVGSNIANIGLVLGVTAIIHKLSTDRDFNRFYWPIMMLFSIFLYYFLSTEQILSAFEGLMLLVGLVLYLLFLVIRTRTKKDIIVEDVDVSLKSTSYFKVLIWLALGILGLYYGSEWLVSGATGIALDFGVSDRIISLTMVALGTSIPELAASVMAAIKKEKDLSLGNLIGSNIFNIGSVLGITALLHPLALESPKMLSSDLIWMLAFAFILMPLALLIPQRFYINRLKGFILLIGYMVFIFMAFFKS